jgi:hypothetical protein
MAFRVPDIADTMTQMVGFEKVGDFAVAILGLSFIDYALKELLTAHNEHLTAAGSRGQVKFTSVTPIGQLFAHGVNLGFIGPSSLKDLRALQQVRNKFAHAPFKLSFQSPEIRRLMSLLIVIREHPEDRLIQLYTNLVMLYLEGCIGQD